MEFIDLKSQQKRIREKIDRRIATVLEHGNYIMGPEIAELEAKLADYVGVKHCIGAASGTDTLLIAMMAFVLGVMAASSLAGSRFQILGSMSTKTGLAPNSAIISAVEIQV